MAGLGWPFPLPPFSSCWTCSSSPSIWKGESALVSHCARSCRAPSSSRFRAHPPMQRNHITKRVLDCTMPGGQWRPVALNAPPQQRNPNSLHIDAITSAGKQTQNFSPWYVSCLCAGNSVWGGGYVPNMWCSYLLPEWDSPAVACDPAACVDQLSDKYPTMGARLGRDKVITGGLLYPIKCWLSANAMQMHP